MLPNRSQALAIAFLATACIVGGAAGWSLKGWAIAARQPHNRDPHAMVVYLTKKLGLSAAQQDSVRTVLERHRMEMDSIWRATRPRLDSLRRVMQVEIEAYLTPTQQERFRELAARHERQRHAADSASQQPWDSDRDGVLNRVDKCPNSPPGAPVDATGCPVHSDHDGAK